MFRAVARRQLASLLDLLLSEFDICDLTTFVAALLRTDARRLADYLDSDVCQAAARAPLPLPTRTTNTTVQTEIETATVGTTTAHGVTTHDVASLATYSLTTGARMVSTEAQCSPPPQMIQRAVQVAPARVATRDAAVSGGTDWETLKQAAMEIARAKVREEVQKEMEADLERAAQRAATAEVQAQRAATMLAEAHEIKRGMRAAFENQAKTAAAVAADRRAAAEDRAAAARDREEHTAMIELLRSRLWAEKHGASWS